VSVQVLSVEVLLMYELPTLCFKASPSLLHGSFAAAVNAVAAAADMFPVRTEAEDRLDQRNKKIKTFFLLWS